MAAHISMRGFIFFICIWNLIERAGMNKSLLPSLAVAVCFMSSVLQANAGSAVFSEDGKNIYLADDRLQFVDLAKPDHLDTIATSPLLAENINAVTRAGDLIVCLSEHQVTSYSPKTRAWKKVADAAVTETFDDLAWDSTNSLLLITLHPDSNDNGFSKVGVWMALDGRIRATVRARGVEYAKAPIFDNHGNLLFGVNGDLWKGYVMFSEGDEKKTEAWLVGERAAALASLETSLGTNLSVGVHEIALAGPAMYVHNQRIGGTGIGDVISMTNPFALGTGDQDSRYSSEAALFSSIKILHDDAEWTAFLAASPDGKTIFYRIGNSGGDTAYLITNNGKPRVLPGLFKKY